MNLRLALSVLAGAGVWLWPIATIPNAAVWPNLFALAMGVLLVNFLPRRNAGGDWAVATGWLLAAGLSAILALMQYFDLEDRFFPLVATTVPGYAYANVRQPNQLATLLGAGLLALAWAVRMQHLRWRHAAWMAGLMLIALAATASHTGVLHLAVITVLVIGWAGASRRHAVLASAAALAIYALAAAALPWLLHETLGIEGRAVLSRLIDGSSCGGRKLLWGNVLHLISLKPWTGWGWGDLAYAHYITLYDGPRLCDKLTNAHNLPLHLAAELGLPAAGLMMTGLAWVIARAKPWRATDPTRQLAWGILALIGVHSLLEYPLWFSNFQVMAALCIWLAWPTRAGETAPASGLRGPGFVPWPRALASVAVLCTLAYAGLDYFRVSQLYLPTAERAPAYRDDPLGHARGSWLFSSEVLFAQVVATDPGPHNAAPLLDASLTALHISPEPRVIERVILCAAALGQTDLAQMHVFRYKAAWPDYYAKWVATQPASR